MEDKPRYSRISDILDLLILMQSKTCGVTLTDIQKRYNVSRRTAERMKDAVLNVLPEAEELDATGKEKHWGLKWKYLNPLVKFSPDEIAQVESIKEYIKFEDKKAILDNVLIKLKALTKNLEQTEDNIEILLKTEGYAVSQKPGYKINISILNTIRQAIVEKQKIKITYNGKEKILAPYGLIYGENIYLIGVEEKKENPYNYLLYKISQIELTDIAFDKEKFDLKTFSNRSFGVFQNNIIEVELLFSKEISDDILNYNFHPTQTIKQNSDGTVTVKFKASGTHEMIWHLFKWGDNVKIISPESLKNEYLEWLKKVLDKQNS